MKSYINPPFFLKIKILLFSEVHSEVLLPYLEVEKTPNQTNQPPTNKQKNPPTPPPPTTSSKDFQLCLIWLESFHSRNQEMEHVWTT